MRFYCIAIFIISRTIENRNSNIVIKDIIELKKLNEKFKRNLYFVRLFQNICIFQ